MRGQQQHKQHGCHDDADDGGGNDPDDDTQRACCLEQTHHAPRSDGVLRNRLVLLEGMRATCDWQRPIELVWHETRPFAACRRLFHVLLVPHMGGVPSGSHHATFLPIDATRPCLTCPGSVPSQEIDESESTLRTPTWGGEEHQDASWRDAWECSMVPCTSTWPEYICNKCGEGC